VVAYNSLFLLNDSGFNYWALIHNASFDANINASFDANISNRAFRPATSKVRLSKKLINKMA
jgi:hypothetical protein